MRSLKQDMLVFDAMLRVFDAGFAFLTLALKRLQECFSFLDFAALPLYVRKSCAFPKVGFFLSRGYAAERRRSLKKKYGPLPVKLSFTANRRA